ncbi:MAG TPA: tetratricopeptide repeat protein, partial [Usitatibacter sp.]|nr:tetratricopeptide repeat protein [Usitatibacter sp.]
SAHQPGFQLTQDNARAVTEICAHLDGLPLAIELAAARIAFESPVALLSHLGTRLRVLVDGARDLPARQQTMRGTLDWSYQLLAPNERAVFRRLALFAGGCDREAADSVCRLRDDEELDVESALPSLVSKNLIRHDGRGDSSTGRVTMLETIREYARDRLQQQGETDATARLHFAYYAALAETASQHLTGTTQGAWLKRLDGEHDNLRVALQWAEESGESEAGLQLAGALWRYWFRRGHLSEGLGWLERFLAHNAMAGHNAVSTARARALSGAGILAHRQGDYSRALALLEQSLADWRALGDDVRSASALNNMALVARAQGSADRAMSLWREALALLPTGADARLTALMLNNLATLHQERADFAHALALYEQSISIRRELGDVFGIANVLGNLGELAREQGDYVRAVALMREALALQRELGDRLSIALSLNNLGIAACDQGSLDEAESLLTESLTLFRQAEDRRNAALTLANLGNVERLRHHDDRARNLIEESLSICQSLGDIQSLGYARLYQGLVAYDQGRAAEAERMLRDALTSLRATGSKTLIARCLEALSRITYGTHPASALRVLAAMGALRATIGAPQSPVERGVCSRLLEDVRAVLGDERFQTIWAEGAAFSLDDAVAEASVAAPGAPSLTDTSAARHHPFILAPRAARGPAAPPPPPSR